MNSRDSISSAKSSLNANYNEIKFSKSAYYMKIVQIEHLKLPPRDH